jgi:AP-1-like factor
MAPPRSVPKSCWDGFGRLTSAQDPYDFQVFDAYNHFNGSGIPEPPTPQSLPKSLAPISNDGIDANSDQNGDQKQGSNSDDEDMTPAQARRKAQNRAA